MTEFNNRINAQRDTLKVVNSQKNYKEPLLGLSEKAIDRWVINNNIHGLDPSVSLLKEISEKLFFLANKSQEQITEDYKILSMKVSGLISELSETLDNQTVENGRFDVNN